MAANRDTLASNRLDSWKEIAAFLGRAERTVKRWESERGLPIHRVPGSGRSAVFAYSHELADWLKGSHQLDSEQPASLDAAEHPQTGAEAANDRPGPTLVAPAELKRTSIPSHIALLIAPLILAVGAAALLFVGHGGFLPRVSASHHISNVDAQNLYLEGRYYWNRRTPEDLNRAIDYFTQAIVKDPGDARPYVGLADCYNLLREFGAMSPSEAYPRALSAARRAVQLDGTSAEAHNSLAFTTFWWSWKAATAEREFKRALQLNPNLVRGHHWYATFLLASHRYPEALEQIDIAQGLDPSSTAILADKGFVLWYAGRRAEALALLKQLEMSEPSLSSTHDYLSRIYLDQQDYPDAIREERTVAELRRDRAGLALADAQARGFATGGIHGFMESQLPLQKQMVDSGGGSAYELAATYAALDEKKEALAYLQVALDRREGGLLTNDPPIQALRDDRVYQRLRAEVKAYLAQ
jgi:tetratricopeptide (TPR) repeat protein